MFSGTTHRFFTHTVYSVHNIGFMQVTIYKGIGFAHSLTFAQCSRRTGSAGCGSVHA